jgi:ABC-type transport system involved in multi-copper enzyme maturation permease subunit
MIRFAWLQFRTQALVAMGVLAVLAVVVAVTGIQLAHAYDTAVATCAPRHDCSAVLNNDRYGTPRGLLSALVIAIPGILGMFWGAPLAAREFETGTFRLAWTQGITRTRWLAAKIGLIGAFSMAVAGLLTLMVTWWTSPFDTAAMDRLNPANFHSEGIVPVGYAAFAFALGFTAGLLIRRTLPAMAVTLVIFTAAQFAVPVWVRPHLISPVQTTSALSMASVVEMGSGDGGSLFVQTQPVIPGAWVLSNQIVTPAGRPATTEPATKACGPQSPSLHACPDYINSLHLRQTVTYQPLSRYWPLQWYETAVYLAVALFLAGLCFLRIRPARSAERNFRSARPSPPALVLRS